MEPLPALVVVAALAVVIGRVASQLWIIRRYRAGQIATRSARWLIFAITGAPYLIFFAFLVVLDPDMWWVALLLLFASWPLIVLPAVMAFDGTCKPH